MTENIGDKKHIENLSGFIENHDNFIISGHISADGDAIASCLGFAELLVQKNKKFDLVFNDDPVDPRFKFLKRFDEIKSTHSEADNSWESAIICDTPSTERLGTVADLLTMPTEDIFRIDHHPGDDKFAANNWEDINKSSTATMVYLLLKYENVKWSKGLADIIMTGIVYDTGRFGYRNTHPEDLIAASEMLELGASIEQISQAIFFNYRLEAMKVFGHGLKESRVYEDGKLAVIFIDHEHMNYITTHEIEELSTWASSVSNALVGAYIREQGPGFYKLSLRSRSDVHVDGIAKSMGGGGHKQASGCRMKGTFEEVIEKLISEFRKAEIEASHSNF